jgi:hypothetical protein
LNGKSFGAACGSASSVHHAILFSRACEAATKRREASKDVADEAGICMFAYVSDQKGLIFKAEVIR